MATHHGKIFKDLVKASGVPAKTVALQLGISGPQVFLLFKRNEIKRPTLLAICEYFKVDINRFSPQGSKDAPSAEKRHQGAVLASLVSERGISQTRLAEALNVTRKSLYNYLRKEELPESVIVRAAAFFKVPVSTFTSAAHPVGEKDIWDLLHALNAKMDEILTRLDVAGIVAVKEKT